MTGHDDPHDDQARDDDARDDDARDHIADGHLGDDVVDLALGHLTGERRAAMAVHLLACPACRAAYDEVVAGIDEVVVAAPEVQPPLGFDERVLARMGVGGARAPARRRPRWVPLGAAAAVLAVVALAVGAFLAVRAPESAEGEQVAVVTASRDGREVGTATRTTVGGEAVLVVGITDPGEGASYTCRMRFADGSTLDTAPWSVMPGAAWLVPLPDDRGDLEDIELVGVDSGATWSTAEF